MTKVDYISDIHLLMYIDENSASRPKKVRKWIDRFLWTKNRTRGDWLIVAGDLSEYNYMNYIFLKECAKIWKNVFFVFGNHDLWLSNRQRKNTNMSSNDKKQDFKHLVNELNNVHVLDNDIIEIDGVRIAGSTNWYHLLESDYKWWNTYSNDSNHILPYGTQSNNQRSMVDRDFLWSLTRDIDVLITHIPPIHFKENHRKPNRAYYHAPIMKSSVNIKYWICGHQHTVSKETYNGMDILSNCLGYPWERKLDGCALRQIEL